MISIVIPVYNQARKLLQTLDSLKKQSFRDYEIIIVNDGSQDGVEVLFIDYIRKSPPDNHYVFINQENHGAPAARNRGFRETRGEYVLFCDADAVLMPTALELMWSVLEQNWSFSYAYSSFQWGRKVFKVGPFDADRLRREPYIHTMSLIRKKDFPAVGWDETIKKFQDWDLWLTMLEDGKAGFFIPQVLFKVATGGTISTWLPSAAYSLLPFLPAVRKYRQAMAVIKIKHGLA